MSQCKFIFEVIGEKGQTQQAIKDRAFVLIGDVLTIKEDEKGAFRKELTKDHTIDYHKTDNGHKGIVTIPLAVSKDVASKDPAVKEAIRVLNKEKGVDNVHLE